MRAKHKETSEIYEMMDFDLFEQKIEICVEENKNRRVVEDDLSNYFLITEEY
ncbi:hypothetical protein [Streptococcus uberis]|uniref:hypothetical protein n=1 Tax=Streptococcus uberis TaxID=1349 RepID=UPI0018A7B45C|nr:hypothetical protein [Streptococcus uberis]